MVNDRGRLGLLVALCSLAGVAVGFGLSNMAMGLHTSRCHVSSTPAPAAAMLHVIAAADEVDTPTWLGVRIQTDNEGGARVVDVEPDSPALRAGIHQGDLVVGFARGCRQPVQEVATSQDLVRLVQDSEVGTHAIVVLDRDGERSRVRARLEHMPESVYRTRFRRR